MGYKSSNWETLNSTGMQIRVSYTTDIISLCDHRSETGTTTAQVPAVVVTATSDNDKSVYVGVSRCSPRDEYSPKLGREIAAGRVLKLWREYDTTPAFVWEPFELDVGEEYDAVAFLPEDLAVFFKVRNGV